MKIALIIPNNIWFAPFVNIYTRVLDEHNIQYDIISWNRDGSEKNYEFQYEETHTTTNRLLKFIPYIKFASFAKKIIKKNKYDRLIVFTSQSAIFMHHFLKKHYKNKYLLDIRDLSIEQQSIFKRPFYNALKNSFANIISSPGYMKCLPKEFKYFISHNFNIDIVRETLDKDITIPFITTETNILTIGGIRNYESNIEVVKSLANIKNTNILFVGKGDASEPIKKYCHENNIKNAQIIGYYKKEDEPEFVKKSSLINIFFPDIISHSTIMSNRFYLALIHKKPMIVTANSTQGDYVEKHRLGLSVENCEGLYDKCIQFLATEDNQAFNRRCNDLLKVFVNDYEVWYKMIYNFVNKA